MRRGGVGGPRQFESGRRELWETRRGVKGELCCLGCDGRAGLGKERGGRRIISTRDDLDGKRSAIAEWGRLWTEGVDTRKGKGA